MTVDEFLDTEADTLPVAAQWHKVEVTPSDTELSSVRSSYAQELDDPDISSKFYSLIHREVGGQGEEAKTAFVESVFNRAKARGMSLNETISDRNYFPGISFKPAKLGEKELSDYGQITANVIGGSNISNFATGNASGKVGFAGGPKTFTAGGENFGVEGPDQGWLTIDEFLGPEEQGKPGVEVGTVTDQKGNVVGLPAQGIPSTSGPQQGPPMVYPMTPEEQSRTGQVMYEPSVTTAGTEQDPINAQGLVPAAVVTPVVDAALRYNPATAIPYAALNALAPERTQGAVEAVGETGAGFTSPNNLAILAATAAMPGGFAGKVAQTTLLAYFEAQAIRQTPELWKQYKESKDPKEQTKLLTEMGLAIGIPIAAMFHVGKGEAKAVEKEVKAGEVTPPEAPTGPEPAAAVPEPEPTTPYAPPKPRVSPETGFTFYPTAEEAPPIVQGEFARVGGPREAAVEAPVEHGEFAKPGYTAVETKPSETAKAEPDVVSTVPARETGPTAIEQIKAKYPDLSDAEAETVRTANEYTDRLRQRADLEEHSPTERRADEAVQRAADAQLRRDPTAGDKLASSIVNRPRVVSDVQQAVLRGHINELEAQHDQLVDHINNTKDPVAVEALNEVRDKLQVAADASAKSGTELGRGLRQRQVEEAKKFNLTKMIADRQAVNGGEPLSPEQLKEVEVAHKKIRDAAEKLEKREAEIAATTKEKPVDKAMLALREHKANVKRGGQGGFIDPEVIKDAAKVGQELFEKGMGYAQWAAQMVERYGPDILDHLPKIWANTMNIDRRKSAGEARGVRNMDNTMISTRTPSGPNKSETAGTGPDALHIGIERMLEDKAYGTRVADAIRPWMPRELRSRNYKHQIENAVEFFKENKVLLYKLAEQEPWLEQAIRQYEGYNKHGHALEEHYQFTPEAVFGSETVMSSGKSPDASFSMAERLMHIIRNASDARWDARMDAGLRKGTEREIPVPRNILRQIRGTKFSELENYVQKAWWARVYDETHHSNRYRIIRPDGTKGDFERNNDGTPASLTWTSSDEIAKAIKLLDGTATPEQLIKSAKHSNYYNSKRAPGSFTPDYVADRHDVSGGFLTPLGSHPTLPKKAHPLLNMHFSGLKNKATGDSFYAIQAEAGRRAAAELGLVPSDFQAGFWSYQRAFMSPRVLGEKAARQIQNVWKDTYSGKRTIDNARSEVFRIAADALAAKRARGYDPTPAWTRESDRSGGGVSDIGETAGYQSELPPVRGAEGAGGPGGGRTDTGGTSEGLAKEFFSSSTEKSNLVDSAEHRKARAIDDDVNEQLGLTGPSHSGVADTMSWGAEDSVMHIITNAVDFDQVRYAAAIKGKLLEQKAMLAFLSDAAGPDAIHSLIVPTKDFAALGKNLNEVGLENRTLLPAGKGTRVVIFDKGTKLADNVDALADKYGTEFTTEPGRGEFVGESETRAESARKYDAIRKDYETRNPERNHYTDRAGDYYERAAEERTLSARAKLLAKESLSDIRGAVSRPLTEQQRLELYKKRTPKQTEELREKVRTGDVTPKTKRSALILDEEAQRLRDDLASAKRDYQMMLEKDRLAKRPMTRKIIDTAVDLERAIKLTGITTFGKLGGAGLQRVGQNVAEEIVGKALSLLPVFRRVMQAAPTEGTPTLRSVGAYGKGFVKGVKQIPSVISGRLETLDVTEQKGVHVPSKYLGLPGRLHGAVKQSFKQAQASMALTKALAATARRGELEAPGAIESAQATAKESGLRAIFTNDNVLSSGWRSFTNWMEHNKKFPTSGYAAAKVAKFMLPIVRVPTNIAIETGVMSSGGTLGVLKLMQVMKRGMKTMKPEEADFIARHLKKGAVGAGLFFLGYMNPDSFGGFYQDPKDKHKMKRSGLQWGEARIFGAVVPRWFLHSPAALMMQFGATTRKLMDSGATKTEAVAHGAHEIVHEVPFVNEMANFDKLLASGWEGERARGRLIKGTFVPQGVQNIGDWLDDKERVAHTPLEYVQSGIPILRERLKVKEKR